MLNVAGTEIRVCGKYTNTDVNSVAQNINIYPAMLLALTPPVLRCKSLPLAATAGPGTAAAYTGNFCWQGHTSVSGAGATAGSIFGDYSFLNYYLSATPAASSSAETPETARSCIPEPRRRQRIREPHLR